MTSGDGNWDALVKEPNIIIWDRDDSANWEVDQCALILRPDRTLSTSTARARRALRMSARDRKNRGNIGATVPNAEGHHL